MWWSSSWRILCKMNGGCPQLPNDLSVELHWLPSMAESDYRASSGTVRMRAAHAKLHTVLLWQRSLTERRNVNAINIMRVLTNTSGKAIMVCVTDFFSTFKTESPLGVWVANVELWSAVAELQHGLVSDLPHMSAKRSGGDLDIVRLSHFLESSTR